MRTGEKERKRLLGLLAKERAELEWPCQNVELRRLVEEGLVARVRDYEAEYGGRTHAISTLAITEAGRRALAEGPL